MAPAGNALYHGQTMAWRPYSMNKKVPDIRLFEQAPEWNGALDVLSMAAIGVALRYRRPVIKHGAVMDIQFPLRSKDETPYCRFLLCQLCRCA